MSRMLTFEKGFEEKTFSAASTMTFLMAGTVLLSRAYRAISCRSIIHGMAGRSEDRGPALVRTGRHDVLGRAGDGNRRFSDKGPVVYPAGVVHGHGGIQRG